MPYSSLDPHSAAAYLQGLDALKPIWGDKPDLEAQEIGDGNLNQVFFITDSVSGKTVVLKQALPYLRVAGDDWPLTRERMRFETEALLFYAEVASDLVPEVYHFDHELSLVVMEHLGGLEVMRRPVTRAERFDSFAENIARFMANTHFFTSDAYLEGPVKKEKQRAFINPQLCKLQEDFVFTNPLMTSPENVWNPALEADVQRLRKDAELKLAVNRAKTSYMTHAQALLHGDLHTGSIMVKGAALKVIDPEFAFYGPQGYDVGTLFANLVLGAASQAYHLEDREARAQYQEYLLGLIPQIWHTYAQTFTKLWREHNEGDLSPPAFWDFEGGEAAFERFQRMYLADVLKDTARHGGCEMLRRLMGIVSVYELVNIPDEEIRLTAERQVIGVAHHWLTQTESLQNVEALVMVAKDTLALTAETR